MTPEDTALLPSSICDGVTNGVAEIGRAVAYRSSVGQIPPKTTGVGLLLDVISAYHHSSLARVGVRRLTREVAVAFVASIPVALGDSPLPLGVGFLAECFVREYGSKAAVANDLGS